MLRARLHHLYQLAASVFSLPARRLRGPSRQLVTCRARWCCWYILRAEGHSYQAIATAAARHHAAVIHGLRALTAATETEPYLALRLDALRRHAWRDAAPLALPYTELNPQ